MELPEQIFFTIIAAGLGLCLGSFATALIYRIPRDISWIFERRGAGQKATRSQCPSCGHALGAIDLIPLISYLMVRGRCRYCRKNISPFKPHVELITMLLLLGQFWAWGGFTAAAWPVFLALPFLIAAVVIDWEHMILPNDLNAAVTILAVIYIALASWQAGWDMAVVLDHVLAGILITVVFVLVSFVVGKIKGRQALGMGDLKFLPAAGFFLGMAAIPSYMALSGVLGLLSAVLKRKKDENGLFPFGPALIISLYFHLFLTGLGFDYRW